MNFFQRDKFIEINKEEFQKLPNISIDYAILEKSSNTYTSEFLGKWSDVGSWHSIKELNLESTESDNAILGEKIFIDDSRSNLIYSKTRTVGVSGVDNLAIIDTPDALLITNLNKRENANKILDKINKEEKGIFDSNEKVFRPWGWYETIDGGNNYQVKRIHVYPKEQLSVQKAFSQIRKMGRNKG